MSDDIAMVTRTCGDCGFPINAPMDAPCPYCADPRHGTTAHLHAALYGLRLAALQRLQSALRSFGHAPKQLKDAVAPDSPRLAEWIGSDGEHVASRIHLLSTVVDVLLALYAISEEIAPPDQLADVIAKVTDDRLDQLPLPGRGPCFCDSGLRYKKCHGRRPR